MNKMPIDNQFINGKITIKNRNPSTEIKIQGQKIAKNQENPPLNQDFKSLLDYYDNFV